MVVADTKDHARAAANKVKVELEQLTEYMNYLDAVKPDAERIHASFDNIYSQQPVLKGDYEHVPEMIDERCIFRRGKLLFIERAAYVDRRRYGSGIL